MNRYTKKKSKFIYIVLIALSPNLFACDCPSIPALNKEIINQTYTTIFQGTIDSIAIKKEKAIAYFQVHDLFKGKITEQIKVEYDYTSDCQINMNTSDTWIIYGHIKNYATVIVNACSRTRKLFANTKEDYYAISSLCSYTDELDYLKQNLGVIEAIENVPHTKDEHILLHPSGRTKIILLFFSIAGFSIIYWLFKRYVK